MQKKTEIQVPVPVSHESGNYNLYLQFQLKNRSPKHDVSIWISNIQNKLSSKSHIYYNENTTFSYTMTLPSSQTSVPVTFGKGDYELTDIQCYTGTEQAFTKDISESRDLYQSVFQSDHNQTKGNQIAGSINVSKAGYFITFIPYDKNFTAYIDGKQTVIEKSKYYIPGISDHHREASYCNPVSCSRGESWKIPEFIRIDDGRCSLYFQAISRFCCFTLLTLFCPLFIISMSEKFR